MAHTCAARAGVILAAERFAAGEVCLALCDVNREAVEDVAATLRAGGEWGGLSPVKASARPFSTVTSQAQIAGQSVVAGAFDDLLAGLIQIVDP